MKTFLLLASLALAALCFPVKGNAQAAAFSNRATDSVVIYFPFAQADLPVEAEKNLDDILERFTQANGFVRIRISGHTDSVGMEARNLALSKRRAQAVYTALTARKIPAGNLLIAYFGEKKPVASNATEDGRRLNRRAVVELLVEPGVMSKAPEPPAAGTPVLPDTPPPAQYSGQVKDEYTGKGIQAVVYYEADGRTDSVRTDAAGHYTLPVPPDALSKIQVFAPGYFFSTAETTRKIESTPLEISLAKADTGETLALRNLHFLPDDTVLMYDSRPELVNILRFMQINPELQVEISGHVSIESYMPMTPELWKLAEDRAKLVYDYLVANGIPAKRMTHKGYGNTKMIFPEPVNAEERRQNRRVEITIVGKD